jgi:hypothetical protein
MIMNNLSNLGAGVCADMICIRQLDTKGAWTPADKAQVKALLMHLKEETDKAISYYKQYRGIDIDK